MLSVTGLSKGFGTRTLFRDVSLRLSAGDRIALVGPNGVGKTTLLEILMGTQPADAGTIHRPKDYRLGYLPQELTEHFDGTVIEAVMAGADHLTELSARMEALEGALADPDEAVRSKAIDDYGAVQARFEQLGGYAIEAEAQRILHGLGFTTERTARPVDELSGGWRMRVALARLLLMQPDAMLLDEPTNHLDVDSVSWLEQQLVDRPGAILFVSHDRDFIDAVATKVIDLSEGTSVEYVGGFAEFVVAREERLENTRAAAANQARKVAQVERFIERFRYKASKARQVQSRVKTLDKLERIEVPDAKQLIAKFGFPQPRRSARAVIEVKDASVGYDGETVLSDVDVVVERGRKLALVGPNGAGKTTLVRLMLGELEPDEGMARLGNQVDVASFGQHDADELDPGRTVYEEFSLGIANRDRNLRSVLGAFGFPGDTAERRVGELSGGERTRLALAKTMADPVNLLVLDEPTNHLDLASCDVLEDALVAYPGTVILVTHDRYLIRSVADSLVVVRDGEARWFDGVDESLLSPGASLAPPTSQSAGPRPSNQRTEQRRADADQRSRRHAATKDLRKRVKRVERQWEKAEAEIVELEQQLADPTVYEDASRVRELSTRHNRAKDRAAELMSEWEYTQQRLEAAEAEHA